MMYKVIIVDDELPAIGEIVELLKEFDNYDVKGGFTNYIEVLNNIKDIKPDIAILDIHIPVMNGIELASKIMDESPGTQVIFATAFDQYAIEAFELSAVDYILKPVKKERLSKALYKAIRNIHIVDHPNEEKNSVFSEQIKLLGKLQVKSENGIVKWNTAKVEELFAYLLLRRGKIISKYNIYADIFPEADEERAKKYLHTCIYQLRKTLKNYNMETVFELKNVDDGYILKSNKITVDLEQFKEIALEAVKNKDIAELWKVDEMYTGDFLDKFDALWIDEERQALKMIYDKVCKLLIRELYGNKDYNKAIEYMDKLLMKDSTNKEYVRIKAKILEKI